MLRIFQFYSTPRTKNSKARTSFRRALLMMEQHHDIYNMIHPIYMKGLLMIFCISLCPL